MSSSVNRGDENTQIVFNVNKVRYADLDTLFTDDEISGTRLITFFLDSVKIFEFMRSDYYKNTAAAIVDDKLTHNLAAEFFNYIGHYRNYFKQCNIKTRFILLHSNTDLQREADESDWNKKYKEYSHPKGKRFLDYVVENRIKVMAALVPDVHIISAPTYESFMVCRSVYPYLLDRNSVVKKDHMKVVITSDPAMYQLANLIGNCSILKASNKSARRIYAHEIFEELTRDYKTPMKRIQPSLLSYYLVLMGNAGIEPVSASLKKKKVLTILSEANPTTLEEVYDLFKEYLEPAGITLSILQKRFYLFDVQERCKNIPNAVAVGIINDISAAEPSSRDAFEANTRYFGDLINLTMLF